MAKKIQHSDLIEDNIFSNTTESAEQLLGKLKLLEQSFKEIAKVTQKELKKNPFKSFEDIKKAEDNIKAADEALKGFNDTTKKTKKVTDDIKQATDDEVKARLKQQAAVNEQKKRLKEIIVLENQEAGTLQKLAARNNILRQEREKLNLDTKEGQDRLKAINAELDKNNDFIKENSDKLKQQKLNVGNYKDSVKDAIKESGVFGESFDKLSKVIEVSKGAFEDISKEIKENIAVLFGKTAATQANTVATEANTAATEAQAVATNASTKATTKGTAAFKLFNNVLKGSVVGAIFAALAALGTFFTKFEEGEDILGKFVAQAGAVFNVLLNRLARAGEGIKNLFTGFFTFDFTKAGQGIDQITAAFSGFGEAVSQAVTDAGNLFTAIDDFGKVIRQTELDLARLNTEQERLNLLINDGTLSFKERERVARRLAALDEEVLSKELNLATKQLEFEKERLRIEANISRDRLENIIATQDAEGAVTEKKLEELIAFQTKVIELEGRVAVEREKIAQSDRIRTQKQTINTLKVIDEVSNLQIEVDKKVAANANATFEQRRDAVNGILEISKNAYETEIEQLQKTTKINIDSNALLSAENSIVLDERIRNLELSDKLEDELRRSINDRKKSIQEAADLEAKIREDQLKAVEKQRNVVNQIEQEQKKGDIAAIESQKELAKLSSEKLRLIEEEYKLQVALVEDSAEFRVNTEKLTAEEIELINEQKNNELEKLEYKRLKEIDAVKKEELKKEQEATKKQLEEIKRIREEFSREALKEIEAEASKRQEALDREIEKRRENIDIQQELAKEGNANAAAQIAFEEEQLAKVEIKKRQVAEREARIKRAIQLVDAYFAAYERYLDDPDTKPNQAATKALANVGQSVAISEVAKALASASFYEGTENVGKSLQGKGKVLNTGKDDYLGLTSSGKFIRFDEDERILTGDQNRMIGDISNDKLSQIALDYRNGRIGYNLSSVGNSINIERKLEENAAKITEAINKKPVQMVDVDAIGNMVERIVAEGVEKRITHLRKHRRI